MKTTAYLSSARTISLVVVATMILGANLTRAYARRITSLTAARQVFAEEYVARFLHLTAEADRKALQAALTAAKVKLVEPEVAAWDAITWTSPPDGEIGLLEIHHESPFPDLGDQRWKGGNELLVVVVRGPRRWAAHLEESHLLDDVVGGPDREKPADALRRMARELDISVPEAWDYAAVFTAIEHEIVEKEVSLQSLGIAFRPDIAPWIVAIVTLGLVLMIRNQVTAVLRDDGDAREEPWLVVDPCDGLERVVATLWLAAIGLAPWTTSATVFFVEAERVVVDGAITSGGRDIAITAGALTILILSAWASVSTVAAVLALRRRRGTELPAQLAPVAGN